MVLDYTYGMDWYWWIVIVIAVLLLLGIAGSLLPTSPDVEARLVARRAARQAAREERLRPWVPEHLRCEAEVDGGDRRCRNQWTERVGNEQVCTEHAELYRIYRDT